MTPSRPHARGAVSLPRAISRAGTATRAEAERLVLAGRVTVGGQVARDPRLRVVPGRDRIEVDGAAIGAPPGPGAEILALNKPRGVLVTRSDPGGRPTAFDLLPRDRGLLRFVGRLDATSAGLLLATADTRLAAALEDPARGVPRVYRAKVRPRLDDARREAMLAGVVIDGKRARPAAIDLQSHGPRSSWVRFTLREGRNREVRRLCAAAGLEVEHLVRVSFGPVRLGDLEPGRWRVLGEEEARALRAQAAPCDGPPRAPRIPGSASRGRTRDG
ncbi:MAG TPA: pseudouridine synthase, partial [Planctomycetota bacterium]|nr:pseudouridine synthase [Planctomycetota bacterium]